MAWLGKSPTHHLQDSNKILAPILFSHITCCMGEQHFSPWMLLPKCYADFIEFVETMHRISGTCMEWILAKVFIAITSLSV